MALLQRAGVDLSRPEPVRAVVAQLDTLVSRLEEALSSYPRSGIRPCVIGGEAPWLLGSLTDVYLDELATLYDAETQALRVLPP